LKRSTQNDRLWDFSESFSLVIVKAAEIGGRQQKVNTIRTMKGIAQGIYSRLIDMHIIMTSAPAQLNNGSVWKIFITKTSQKLIDGHSIDK